MNGNENKNENKSLVRLFAPDLDERLGGLAVGTTHDADEASRSLVSRASTITSVTTLQDQDVAVSIARDIRTYVSQVAKARVVLTQPLDRVKARCIEVEREHTGPLVEAQRKLERMVTDFQLAELRRVAEEDRKRREELAKLEQGRRALEAKAAAAAATARTAKQEKRAAEMEAEANLASLRAQEALRAPPPEVVKPKGMAVRRDVKWRCDDVRKLYAARPELCNLEPKAGAIRAVCFPTQEATEIAPDTTTVPGLALWWETNASTRRG
jgi:hypothetical protein